MDHDAAGQPTVTQAEKAFKGYLDTLLDHLSFQGKEGDRAKKLIADLKKVFESVTHTAEEHRREHMIGQLKIHLEELEQLFMGQQRLFNASSAGKILARFLQAQALDSAVAMCFRELYELVGMLEKIIQTADAGTMGLVKRGPQSPRKKAPKTYAQAQAEILQGLRSKGWAVSDGLKIPHATKGDFRFWFKSQAIYYSQGKDVKNFGEARSAWVPDYRHMTTEQMTAHLENFAKKA